MFDDTTPAVDGRSSREDNNCGVLHGAQKTKHKSDRRKKTAM